MTLERKPPQGEGERLHSSWQHRDPDGTVHTIIMDPTAVKDIQDDADYLREMVMEMRRKMPSDEDMAFLRNEREARERYQWAWSLLRQYAGWSVVAVSLFASAVVGVAKGVSWLVENVQWKPH